MKIFDSHINRYIFILLNFAAITLSFFFYKLTQIDKDDNLLSQLENGLTTTRYLFEEQKRYALSLSILLSQDQELKNSFLKKDRKESFKIVNKKISLLKKLQDSNFDVQIHNKDLTTYIRSWDFTKKDIPLESFRQGVVKVSKEKKPLVSIELGKRLNIKAISPIFKDNEQIGSIEVIIGFDYLENELKQKGYETFILLENKYLKIADTLIENEKIQNYTLVNDNNKNTNLLKKFDLKKLKDYGYFTSEKKAFSYFSIYSLTREKLGYIVIALSNDDNVIIDNSYEKQRVIDKSGIIIE
ncbi:cache domain-containing protein [Halarcobacter sp.]|uniref:cache domain-containing protein n=1 Tax=Halarcobacter sp. TaxID=2321133 RepID=UPI002AA5FFC3|nr:cache domain-containing protein [Halarcobacter sp.]